MLTGWLALRIPWVQHLFAPSDYYREWWNPNKYMEKTTFLPAINNEISSAYEEGYATRMKRLTNFAMFMWEDDTIIGPRESSHFGYYSRWYHKKGLRDSLAYKFDFIGMKTLDEASKLWFYSGPGDHMSNSDTYIPMYLTPFLLGTEPEASLF